MIVQKYMELLHVYPTGPWLLSLSVVTSEAWHSEPCHGHSGHPVANMAVASGSADVCQDRFLRETVMETSVHTREGVRWCVLCSGRPGQWEAWAEKMPWVR